MEEYHEKRSAAAYIAQNKPETKKRRSDANVASWANPEIKARRSKGISSALATPEHKEKRRAQTEREHNAYVAYQSNGGSLKWNAWRHAGQPTHD